MYCCFLVDDKAVAADGQVTYEVRSSVVIKPVYPRILRFQNNSEQHDRQK